MLILFSFNTVLKVYLFPKCIENKRTQLQLSNKYENISIVIIYDEKEHNKMLLKSNINNFTPTFLVTHTVILFISFIYLCQIYDMDV